ncbi:MAG: DoxX family protein [Phycisphaerales bacterium]|nr:DoxX family protein [Phycisphaerales bacterium]
MADQPTLTMRQRTAIGVPPLLLRLALAVTFIWAGYAKIFGTFEVTEDNRAALVAAGVISDGSTDPVVPADPEGDTEQPEPPAEDPAEATEETPVETTADPGGEGETTTEPEETTTSPVEPAQGEPDPGEEPGFASLAGDGRVTLVSQSTEPQRVRNYNGLAMLMYGAGNPQPVEADGETTTPMALVPSTFASPPWPTRLALLAAVTELVAGVGLLIGLLTRVGGLSVAGVMAVAMWLTQIGPALQSGNTWLGFLPLNDPWNIATYSTFLWQLALMAAGLALVFSGPGTLSLDRFLFGRGGRDDED